MVLLKRVLSATDDVSRVAVIDEANGLLAELEAVGAISHDARLCAGRVWIKAYARGRLPESYRTKDAKVVAELGWFLKAG